VENKLPLFIRNSKDSEKSCVGEQDSLGCYRTCYDGHTRLAIVLYIFQHSDLLH